jgi:hypothetical protein
MAHLGFHFVITKQNAICLLKIRKFVSCLDVSLSTRECVGYNATVSLELEFLRSEFQLLILSIHLLLYHFVGEIETA